MWPQMAHMTIVLCCIVVCCIVNTVFCLYNNVALLYLPQLLWKIPIDHLKRLMAKRCVIRDRTTQLGEFPA